MSWIQAPDGTLIYGKRKTLGIKVWLSPVGEDTDGEIYYNIWMEGRLGKRVPFKMNGELATLSEHPAKMKAEIFAYDVFAIARCHGMTTCFGKCPRCTKLQKTTVILATTEDEKDLLECGFCGHKY